MNDTPFSLPRDALDALHEPVVALDRQGVVIDLNQAFVEAFQVEREQALGRSLFALGNGAWDFPRMRRLLDEVLAERSAVESYSIDHTFAALGRRILLVNARRLFDSGGRSGATLLAIDDVTDRTLQAAERERLANIVDSAQAAIVGQSLEGTILSWNEGAARLYGYAAEEALGRPITLIIPPDRIEELRACYSRLKKGQRMEPIETVWLAKGGRRVPVSLALSAVYDSDDRLSGFSSIAQDISQRKHFERELKRANRELLDKNRELEQFVYTVSHDLKSPLVTMTGFLGMIEEDLAEGSVENLADSLGRVLRAAQRMNELIDNLLTLSRIGRARGESEPIDLGEVAAQLGEDFAERFAAAGVAWQVDKPLPALRADRSKLVEALDNLITNALKYGCDAPQPRITLGAEEDEDQIVVFVRDNGAGIPAEYHERIFGLFQRLDNRREGTGVGLAIVARVMEVHGGRAWVESVPGQGATFRLSFPKEPRGE